jgi:uncharacterized protein YuzE
MSELTYNPDNDVLSIYLEDPSSLEDQKLIISCGDGIETIILEDEDEIVGLKVANLSSYLKPKELTEEEKELMAKTDKMSLEEFISYALENMPEFKASAIYSPEMDSLEIICKNTRSCLSGSTLDGGIDTYKDLNGKTVGCKIWNILNVIEEHGKK